MKILNKFKIKLHEYNTDTVLIHIGKCGGSSVRNQLKAKKINFVEKHVAKIQFQKNKKYIIVIRNPISRFISAFNWRYKLVVEDKGVQENRFEGEKKILKKFGTVNNLAENIYNSNGDLIIDLQKDEFYIHHIKEDINYHLGSMLKKCKKENITAVLTTETLSDDMKSHFNIDLTVHLKSNKKKVELSDLALRNLRRYLQKDYECIEELKKLGVLTVEQYNNLSK